MYYSNIINPISLTQHPISNIQHLITMKSIHFILSIPAAAIILQACSSAEGSKAIPAANAPIPVQVISLQKEEISRPVITSGQFTTDDETTLVLVKEGDYVRKGQLLATLDLTEIRAGVSQAELGYQKALRDFTRAGNLYRDSVATLEQYQNAETALAFAAEQLNAARFNLNFSEIRAASNGYVLKKFASDGQVVSPGSAIIRINGAGNAQWIFKAGVSDKEWALIQLQDEASIYVDALPDTPVRARVIRKSEGADPVSGAFTIDLLAEAGKDVPLASGLFGTATIIPARKSSVWSIPHDALLDGNANQGFVFVTSDQKTARKIPVTVASVDNDFIRISGGLENASALITKGSAYLTDSSEIQVVKSQIAEGR
jgi:RND family efflux transporter MFP subunit